MKEDGPGSPEAPALLLLLSGCGASFWPLSGFSHPHSTAQPWGQEPVVAL